MGIEKFGTDAVELNTATGGIVSADGAILLDTANGGAASVMVGQNVLREIQAGVANGTWASTPPNPDDAISSTNPLPYFDIGTNDSAGNITAKVVTSSTTPGGRVLRFNITPATYSSLKTFEFYRFIPVAGSAARSFAYALELAATNSSGTGGSPAVRLSGQFYRADGTTATGTSFDVSMAFSSAAGLTVGTLQAPAWSTYDSTWARTTVPADAAYLRVGFQAEITGTVTVAQTIDIVEVRAIAGQANVIIPDTNSPQTYAPAMVYQTDGVMYLKADSSTAGGASVYLDSPSGVFGFGYGNANALQLTNTTDVTAGSTANALTIGASKTTGDRVKFDTNEISAFSTSGVSALNLNPSGGNVNINTSQTNNYTVIGGSTIQATATATGSNVLQTYVTTDANNRFKLEANGKMSWGPGSGAVDTDLSRSGAATLSTTSDFTSTGVVTGAAVASNGSVTAAGAMTATNISLSGTNGLRHDTPATTSGTGQIAGEGMWVLVSGTQYQLRRSTGTSWARFKDEIAATSISPEQFAALDLVQFKWNAEKMQAQFPTLDGVSPDMQHGVLLDQLSDVLPEAVQQPQGPGDIETVNWHMVHMAAMVALKDAMARIENLERRLADLEG